MEALYLQHTALHMAIRQIAEQVKEKSLLLDVCTCVAHDATWIGLQEERVEGAKVLHHLL